MTTTRSTTFTTTVRVIYRVHGNTTNGRTNTTPALGTRFTQLDQAMLGIADLTNRCTAIDRHFTHLA